jgi:hypothetical protein
MTEREDSLLEPLSRFVLEILPWALSGLIGIYLAWGLWSAPASARPELKPVTYVSASLRPTTPARALLHVR